MRLIAALVAFALVFGPLAFLAWWIVPHAGFVAAFWLGVLFGVALMLLAGVLVFGRWRPLRVLRGHPR